MFEFQGDFLGFTFNGRHSSEFGIVRTIDNRMDLNLRPESKDITMEVPGMDGSYYYGTNYTKRNFNIKFAFAAMSEQQLQEMKAWLMDKKIHPLIFDETDYKAYSAKATGMSNVSHLCFEENGQRVYRGEGTIQFVCNYPFATSTNNDDITNYINKGDLSMPFKIKVEDLTLAEKQVKLSVLLPNQEKEEVYFEAKLKKEKSSGGGYAEIDMKDQMIYEYSSKSKRLGILNHQITSGNFFELPKGASLFSKKEGIIQDFKYIYY